MYFYSVNRSKYVIMQDAMVTIKYCGISILNIVVYLLYIKYCGISIFIYENTSKKKYRINGQ